MNQIVDLFRKSFPDTQATDEQLTELLYDVTRDNPVFDQFDKQFVSDALTIKHARGAARPGNEFSRSFASGVDVLQSQLGGAAALAGHVIGSEGLKQAGLEMRRKNLEEAAPNAPTISRIGDIQDVGDVGRYLAGLAGSQAPQLGASIGATLLGTAATRSPVLGALSALPLTFSQTQNFGDLLDKGADPNEAATAAVAVGAVSSLLETALPYAIASKVFKPVSTPVTREYVAKVIGLIPSMAAKAAVSNAAKEGSTEVLQELASMAGELYVDRDKKGTSLTSREVIDRLVNAGVAGALLGAATGPLEHAADRADTKSPVEDKAKVTPPVPPVAGPTPVQSSETVPGQRPNDATPPSDEESGAKLDEDQAQSDEAGGVDASNPQPTPLTPDQVQFLTSAAQSALNGDITQDQEFEFIDQIKDDSLMLEAYVEIRSQLEAATVSSETTQQQGKGGDLVERNETDAERQGQGRKDDSQVVQEVVSSTAKEPIVEPEPVVDTPKQVVPPPVIQPDVKPNPPVLSPNPIDDDVADYPSKAWLEKRQSGRGKNRDKAGAGEKAVVQKRAFVVTGDVDEELVSMASSDDPNDKKSMTHRITYFEDQETGEVIGVGTYKQAGTIRVGPFAEGTTGTTLKKLKEQGRYVPIFSMLVGTKRDASNPASARRYADAKEFEEKVQKPAIAAQGARAQSAEDALEPDAKGYGDTEGEVVAVAQTESQDDIRTINLAMMDVLPRDKSGKIRRDLLLQDIVEAMALANKEDPNFIRAVIRVMAGHIKDNKDFAALPQEQQRLAVIRYVAQQIQKAIKDGGYDEEFIHGEDGPDLIGYSGTDSAEQGGGDDDRSDNKFRSPTLREQSAPVSDDETRQAYHATLDALSLQGVDVTVLRDALNGIVAEYGATIGGRSVVLSVADAANPTRANFITLLHEAGHALFSTLSPSEQLKIQQAITGLKVGGWAPTLDPRLSNVEADVVRQEEHLVESAARALEERGFNPSKALTIAQKVGALIKKLYLQVAMAIQKALLGTVSQEMAVAWFSHRLETFLRQQPVGLGMVQFLGGPKPEAADFHRLYTAEDGSGWVPVRYNFETGQMESQPVLPDSAAAAVQNVRNAFIKYQAPTRANQATMPLPRNADAAIATADRNIAVQNEFEAVLREVYQAWNASGANTKNITFEEFVSNGVVAGVGKPWPNTPSTIIASINETLSDMGISARPTTRRISSLGTDIAMQDVARVVLPVLINAKADMQAKARDAKHWLDPNNPRNIGDRINTSAAKLNALVTAYANNKSGQERATKIIDDLLLQVVRDAEKVSVESYKVGGISRVIAEIEGRITEPVLKAYRNAVNRIWSEANGKQRLYDMLSTVATTSQIDWENDTYQTIDNKLMILAGSEQDAAMLDGDSEEAKALRKLVIAFGRENDAEMAGMELARSRSIIERTKVVLALKGMLTKSESEVKQARAELKELGRLGVLGERIFAKLDRVRQKNRALREQKKSYEEVIALEAVATPVFNTAINDVAGNIDAVKKIFEVQHGATYYVPDSPSLSSTDVFDDKFKKTIKLDGMGIPVNSVRDDRRAIREWLNYNQAPSLARTHLQQVADKLEMVEAGIKKDALEPSLTTRMLGSFTKVMRSIGLPSTKVLERQMIRFSFLMESYLPQTVPLSAKWDRAESDAMKLAVPANWNIEQFRKVFYYDALKFIASHDYLLLSMSPEAAETQALTYLKRYFQGNPETAAVMSKAGAWDALLNYYRETSKYNQWMSRVAKSPDIGLLVEDDTFYRKPIGYGLFHIPRGPSPLIESVFSAMRPEWHNGHVSLDPKKTTDTYTALGRDALIKQLEKRFTPDVWKNFVGPMARRNVRSLFSAPSGMLAVDANCKAAFEQSSNVVEFAEKLYALEGGSSHKTVGEFVGETIYTFQQHFNVLNKYFADHSAMPSQDGAAVRHYMMDARKSEDWPSEWVRYVTFDRSSAHNAIKTFIYGSAFGRNETSVWINFDIADKSLTSLVHEHDEILDRVITANPRASQRKLDKAFKAEATRVSGDSRHWIELKNARRNQRSLNHERQLLVAMIKANDTRQMEIRNWYEVVTAMTIGTIQGAGTALIDTISLVEQPLRKFGLNQTSASLIARTGKSYALRAMGSVLQAFQQTTVFQAEYARRLQELGFVDTDANMTLKQRLASAMSVPFVPSIDIAPVAMLEKGVVKTARAAKALMATGVGRVKDGDIMYPTAKLAVYTWSAQLSNEAAIIAWWQTAEDLVMRGIQFYQDNPSINHKTYEVTPDDLGYGAGFFGLNRNADAFRFMKAKLEDFGINLDTAIEEGVLRHAVGLPVFTDSQYRALAALIRNEITLDANQTNRPTKQFADPMVHMGMPLIGWSIAKSVDVVTNLRRNEDGRVASRALAKSFWAYSAILPLGLAYALLRDEYDEELLKKKSNVRSINDKDEKYRYLIDALDRVGTFGLAGNVVNTAVNKDINRELSVDKRVFFVSSTLNFLQAIGTWISQGDATYATVYRPMMQALGGAGVLQHAQIVNNLLSLDNQEARVTARLNAGNLIRSACRGVGIELRKSGGFAAVPNATTPHISNMMLAAMANDAKEFQASWSKAVEAELKAGQSKPEATVAQKFMSRNPIKTIPAYALTQEEVVVLLNQIPERQRKDVVAAISLFNSYSEMIGGKQYLGMKTRPDGTSKLK